MFGCLRSRAVVPASGIATLSQMRSATLQADLPSSDTTTYLPSIISKSATALSIQTTSLSFVASWTTISPAATRSMRWSADDCQPIFEAIIAMACALKIPVTVEGVETQIQINYISRPGCNYMQGHFLARPMKLPALLNLLHVNDPLSRWG